MWYSSFDNGPIGENEDEAREAVVEYMEVEDYLALFLDDSDLMEKVIRWCINSGIFALNLKTSWKILKSGSSKKMLITQKRMKKM